MKTKELLAALVAFTLSVPANGGVQEGIAAINRGDYETAFDEFKVLAEAGDDTAMITIGLWFLEGTGFDQDYDIAMAWYLKAFEKGNGDAYNNIGVMYRDGLGVETNKQANSLCAVPAYSSPQPWFGINTVSSKQ